MHLTDKECDDCLTCLGTGTVWYSGQPEDVVGREEWGDVQLATYLIESTFERGWAPDEFLRQPAKWVSAYFSVAGLMLQELKRQREAQVVSDGQLLAGRDPA